MAKPEWGLKRICHSCGTRYYDMRRATIACPKCGTEFDPEALLKSRRGRTAAIAGAAAPDAAAPDDEVLADDAEKGDEEEELIEDTAELGEDDDDVAEVIENVDEDDER